MKKMVFFLSLFLIAVMITSCSGIKSKIRGDGDNASADRPKKEKVAKERKSADNIEIFEAGEKPPRPYKKLGRISVDKYNFGIPRSSDACLNNLKRQAANKGGDGIIGFSEDMGSMSGTVIIYEKPDTEMKPADTSLAEQPKRKPTTNADVIMMIKAKLPETTIISAIKQGPSDFDTSPLALIELKNQGATGGMLDAMLGKTK